MKNKKLLGVILVIFNLFSSSAKAAPEDTFWQWFTKNENKLFEFEVKQEVLFDELGSEMARVHSDLTFEFGPVLASGKREFVISAGGIKSAFPAVEALFEKAPDMERWTWIKYRPRRTPIFDIEFSGKKISANDVHYILVKDNDKPGIVMFFDGYNEKDEATFGQIGYLFIDEALGEYDVEMKVGFIEFQSRESKYFPSASPLKELSNHFDEYWANRAH